MTAEPHSRCYCGHVRHNHIHGEGMCLICRGIGCLIFRAAPSRTEATSV